MLNSKLLDIINYTRGNESDNKYGYQEIATDLHTELDLEELELKFEWL